MTEKQFFEDARKRGFNTIAEFDNVFTFMDYCYRNRLTDANSMCWVKEDGSGLHYCIIAY